MREPRKPPKPSQLGGPARSRSRGGEVPPKSTPVRPEDVIPTAPVDPDDFDHELDDFDDEYATWAEADSRHDARDTDGEYGAGVYVGSSARGVSEFADDADELTDERVSAREESRDSQPRAIAARGRALVQRSRDAASAGLARVTGRFSSAEQTANPQQPTRLSDRRRERTRERRRIQIKRVGIGAGLIALIIGIVWVAFSSPLFQYRYSPEHISGIADDSIVDRAAVESKLASYDGAALLTLNEVNLARDIEESIPEIDRVEIGIDLPRSLRVVVTPHTPVACVVEGDGCIALSEDGTRLDIDATAAEALPRVGSIAEGQDPAETLKTMLEVLGHLDEPVRAQVEQVDVEANGLITMKLTEGRTVNWGTEERSDFKAQILQTLLSVPASVYDVSVPDAPVTS